MNKTDFSLARPEGKPNRTLIYGEATTGKTTALATIPSECLPAALMDIDEKSDILFGKFQPGQLVGYTFDVFKPKDPKKRGTQLDEPILYEQVKEALVEVGNDPEIRTIIIDSMSFLYNGILNHVRFLSKRKDEDPTTQPDYGIALNLTVKLINVLKNTQKHLILNCHETTAESDVGGITKGAPALTGQLATLVPKFFQDILHTKSTKRDGDRVYLWDTEQAGPYIAGTARQIGAEIDQDFGVLWTAPGKKI